jgi:hypothetical protein
MLMGSPIVVIILLIIATANFLLPLRKGVLQSASQTSLSGTSATWSWRGRLSSRSGNKGSAPISLLGIFDFP